MKKGIYLIGLIIAFLSIKGFSQSTPIKANADQLKKTAQIWGFLKYYHPSVASGNYDWDQQLLKVIDQLDSSFSKLETETLFSQWINSLGTIPECTSCSEDSELQVTGKNFDLSWIEGFESELENQLKNIRYNRYQGEHHYFSQSEDNFVMEFKNEPEYEDNFWENPKLRLLTLFRYWNYIEYFYPFKHTLDSHWSSTLKELIPKFLSVQTETGFHLLLLETVTLLEDSHAYFSSALISKHLGEKTLPFKVKFINNTAVVSDIYNDSLAAIDNIKIGDEINEIADTPLSDILESKLKYVPGSNIASKLRDAKPIIFNGAADSLLVTIRRVDQISRRHIKRYDLSKVSIKSASTKSWEIIEGNIGYVNMGLLTPDLVDSMMNEFSDTEGVIFDLRNYPNNTFNPLCNCINNQAIPFTKILIADASYPGRFIWLPFTMNCGTVNGRSYENPIVILVNEETQSQAEFTAMALSTAKKAKVIGSQTAGADGNANKFNLPGGFDTMFTGIGIYYPDGKPTQRIGVNVDKIIEETVESIRSGKDEVLDYAIRMIREE